YLFVLNLLGLDDTMPRPVASQNFPPQAAASAFLKQHRQTRSTIHAVTTAPHRPPAPSPRYGDRPDTVYNSHPRPVQGVDNPDQQRNPPTRILLLLPSQIYGLPLFAPSPALLVLQIGVAVAACANVSAIYPKPNKPLGWYIR